MIEAAAQNRPRILVVDDEEPNRLLLDALLVPEGYEVLQAKDGEEALQAVAEGGLDVVLLDVRMPEMNGFEVCKRIRNELGQRLLPVVFITAVADRMARIQGKEAGADDFLSKPLDNLELLARVRNLAQVKAYHDLRERQRQAVEEELDRTRGLLIHSERLASLGTLAAGVGHELKNVAQIQIIALDMLRDELAAGSPRATEAVKLLQGVQEHLILHAKHLLHLGRPGPDRVGPTDLCALTRSTLEMLRATGKTRYVSVVQELDKDPVTVSVNQVRIEQVLVNLVGNAVDALTATSRRGRQITVKVSADGAAGLARCSIADNGCGIPAAVQPRLFEPYLTTKEPGRGTGLGLVVVKTIIASYGGTLAIESAENVGTTVSFTLPLSAQPARAAAPGA